MKTIKLKRLELENFKCFANKNVYFGDRCTVRGANGVGKTTLYDALLWILFDKTAKGDSANSVRPHGKDGKDIDFVDISVSATFDVDGREITLKKVQKQNWVKDRTTQQQTFKGNENTFEVNGIPKKLKDYKDYVAEYFCPEDVFLSCTNSNSFFKLDAKKRRIALMNLASDVTDAAVIASNDEFRLLADEVKDGTIDELITRSKASRKKLNERLESIPARIDEQHKSRVDIDVAELELAKAELQRKIDDATEKSLNTSLNLQDRDNIVNDILRLKKERDEYRDEQEKMLMDRRRKSNIELSDKNNTMFQTNRKLSDVKSEVSRLKEDILSLEKERKSLSDKWKSVNSEEFDKTSLICPTCKRELPEEECNILEKEFNDDKANRISVIIERGNRAKELIEKYKNMLEKLNDEQIKLQSKVPELKREIEEMEAQNSQIPCVVDLSQDKKYTDIVKLIEEKTKDLSTFESTEAMEKELNLVIRKYNSELKEIESEIARAARNNDIDIRIEQLTSEQRSLSQMIADEEKKLDLLERFNRDKMSMLTESVNEHFSIVKFVLFQNQINGGYADCCKATVDGTDYDSGLNHGHRILADLDILSTFQRINAVSLPIFVDDSESVDAWRLPNLDTQMILLRRTDDKEMIVD